MGIDFISGVHGAIRTPDRSLRRRMLYPLSYEDILCTHLIYQIWHGISIRNSKNGIKKPTIKASRG